MRKCPYCPFYSFRASEEEMALYLDALRAEFALWKDLCGRLPIVNTLYLGGGTPTVLPPHLWERLIGLLDGALDFVPCLEVTVEANPDSLSPDHLRIFKEWRINRLSVGVQSFDDHELSWLARSYDRHQAIEAVERSVSAGFAVSVDLLFGLYGQTLRKWHKSVALTLALGVSHLSTYQLTLEPGTPWGSSQPEGLPNGYPFYRWAQWYLEKKGFMQYEIASFSLPGKWCHHNLAYWHGGNVLGLGAGAWSYLEGLRFGNVNSYSRYMESIAERALPVAFWERLDGEKRAREAAVLALRTRWGISIESFIRKYGLSYTKKILDSMDNFPEECLVVGRGRIALSKKGRRVANALWADII
ncbi:MAG: coproporphyrinogen III oxidase family protein [Synergistales bacterium]|nr:coproporphyrinogen III oxidase family protein [Synergistales bacterium]